jgi:peptidyl-dipeptidase Dcp
MPSSGFKEHGGLTRENGDRFRAHGALTRQHRRPGKMYKDWRGKDPSIEPMLIDRGLKDAPKK